jgi:Asp-tRNA(Asn)/Glu-tRNA(Gln) amidotransferase A subunit family amidase
MPVGAQVMSRQFADLRCLSVAQLLEDALGIVTPIDPR